jgi:hypothetical protein
MMGLRHILAALCEMFPISWLMDRYRRTHCMASTLTGLESTGFLPVRTPKPPCVCSSSWHFPIALWMPVRLSAIASASLGGCGGPWWDVSRRALNLMEDILNTYYKCTLSTVTHKLNVSGHMLIRTFFLVFVCETRARICPQLSVTPCM